MSRLEASDIGLPFINQRSEIRNQRSGQAFVGGQQLAVGRQSHSHIKDNPRTPAIIFLPDFEVVVGHAFNFCIKTMPL
jgi:hypothetical protein